MISLVVLGLSIGYELLMCSSLLSFRAIYCHHRTLVLIVTILVTIINGITADCKYVNSVSFIRSVTTRSQSHLLAGNRIEPPQVCSVSSPLLLQDISTTVLYSSDLQSTDSRPMSLNVHFPSVVLQQTTSDNTSSLDFVDNFSRGETMGISKFQMLKLSKTAVTYVEFLKSSSIVPCHSLAISNFQNTASDYQDDNQPQSNQDHKPTESMKQLFTSLLNQLSSHTTRIQEQIQQNDLQMSIAEEHFKNEVWHELNEFRAFLATQHCNGNSTTPVQ
jgi:hypothetical protein